MALKMTEIERNNESWRQAIRELRDLAIEEGAVATDRRCIDLILFGPSLRSPQHSTEKDS